MVTRSFNIAVNHLDAKERLWASALETELV